MTDKTSNNLIVEATNETFHDKSTTTLEYCARRLELYAMFAEATWLRDVAVEIKQKDEEIENLKKQLQEKVFSCKYFEEKNKSLLTK